MDAQDDSSVRPPRQIGDAVADLRAGLDATLEVRDRLSGGLQGGSWLLENTFGSLLVLKVTDSASLLARREETIGLVERLVDRGYPTPPWLKTGLTAHGVGYVLTPYVEGKPPTWSALDLPRLIDAIELQAGVAAQSPSTWSDYIATVFAPDSEAIASLREAGPESSALADAALDIADQIGPVSLPAADAVHGDMCLANLLALHDGSPVIVDIDACGAGTRALDYAWLYRDGATTALPTVSLDLIRSAGEAVVGAEAFRYLVAGACCELLAFQTRHGPGHMIPAHSQNLLDCMSSLR